MKLLKVNRLGLTLSKIFGSLCCSELQKSDLYVLFSSSRAAIKGIARYTTVLQQRRPLTIDRGAGASCIKTLLRGERRKNSFFSFLLKYLGSVSSFRGKKLHGFFLLIEGEPGSFNEAGESPMPLSTCLSFLRLLQHAKKIISFFY